MTPIEKMKACKTVDELFSLWKENVGSWKKRKDFNEILDVKDNAKYRLQWPTTLKNAMLRYNETVDSVDDTSGVSETIRAIDEGRTLELQMAELIQRVLDSRWPIDADGLKVMKSYVDWRQNVKQIRFEVTT